MLLKKIKEKKPPVLKKPKKIRKEVAKEQKERFHLLQESQKQQALLKDNLEELHKNLMQLRSRL